MITRSQKSRWKWVVLLGVALLAVIAGLIGLYRPPADEKLSDLNGLEHFRQQFNQDQGKPRLVLLLSPT